MPAPPPMPVGPAAVRTMPKLGLMLADLLVSGEMPDERCEILEAVVCDEDAKTIAEEWMRSEDAVRGCLEGMRKNFFDLRDERRLSHLCSRQEEREGSERSDAAAA